MRIRFLGAANEVTGSMHLLETEAGSILVDCGLYQGRRDESRQRNRNLPVEATKADAVLLTHAHIDHAGSIPTLVKRGFGGTIYATPATRDLCGYMLRDSARIQEGDASYLNKKFAADPEWKTIAPLYDEDDAVKALGSFVSIPYGKKFSPLPGVQATFLDAGHILGSAQIVLDVQDRGKPRRLLFSGDLGRKGLPILRDPETPAPPIDYVLMESTYGGRVHGSVAQMHDDLERVIKATIERGGKVIIPAFAVGRTQEIIYFLNHLKRSGRLPDVPVFIDSPLSIGVTSVFKLHPECYDKETRAFLDEHGEVFDFEGVRFVQSREESMSLNKLREPAVIIASSGMCEAGRIVHHLKNNIEDDRNTILVVGYMAQHTLGRRIVERRPRVRVLGVERDLRAHVEVLNSFSAHADSKDLLEFAGSLGPQTSHFYLIHGEPAQQEPLLAELANRKLKASAPARGAVEELA
jgi:metallo-beta-lactamase family protein